MSQIPDPHEKPTMTADEVAKVLGLGRSSVYLAIANKEIPAIKVGHRYLVPTMAVVRMLRLDEPTSRPA